MNIELLFNDKKSEIVLAKKKRLVVVVAVLLPKNLVVNRLGNMKKYLSIKH